MDQNIAVETVILAYMVNHPGLYQQLAHYPAEIFYDEDHRIWFDAIRDCYSEAGECDSVALRTRMINEGHESAFTGKFQQIILSPSIPTSLNTHVEALLDSYNLRRIKGFASDVMQCRTAEQAQKIMALAVNDALIDGGDNGESIADIAKREDELTAVDKVTPTGFIGIDKVLRGFGETELVIVGGHAKQGKTTAALQLAFDMSRIDETNYYSLEMPRRELVKKIVCRKANVEYGRLSAGTLATEERSRVKTMLDLFKTGAYKFSVFDGYMHIDAILAHAKISVMQKNLKRVVVDYLQLCEVTKERGMSRYEIVGSVSRKLKLFAMKYGVNVIALSQFNGDMNEEPNLQSFRESGNIGQDCNIALAVWYDPKEQQRKFILLPGRRCEKTVINVDYRGAFSEFVDRSVQYAQPWEQGVRP